MVHAANLILTRTSLRAYNCYVCQLSSRNTG